MTPSNLPPGVTDAMTDHSGCYRGDDRDVLADQVSQARAICARGLDLCDDVADDGIADHLAENVMEAATELHDYLRRRLEGTETDHD